MDKNDRVRHMEYGIGTITNILGKHCFVIWDKGGSSMEPIQNLQKVEK
jgi:hypothetical protein